MNAKATISLIQSTLVSLLMAAVCIGCSAQGPDSTKTIPGDDPDTGIECADVVSQGPFVHLLSMIMASILLAAFLTPSAFVHRRKCRL